jgi:RNA polymerase sigma factor (sigma-70 family)
VHPAEENDPLRALEALASGGLRGPESGAWGLIQAAWPEVIARTGAFLRSMGVPPDSAEDCGQAALLRVWRFRRSYRGSSLPELLGWMYRICRNEAARRLGQRELPTKDIELEPEALASAGDPTAQEVEAADALRALEACLGELEPRLRELVELLYAEAPLTEREAEEVLGISKSYVNVLRRKALELLGRCLETKGAA